MNVVPQSKYDDNYYHDCEGWTEDGMPGKRLKTLYKFIPEDAKNIVDIGCGRGETAKYFEDRFVLSMDYSIASMKRFHEVNEDRKTFIRHDVSKGMSWLESGFFDCAVLADIVEHLYHEQLMVLGLETVRLVKSEGIILIDTPIMKGGESELHVDIKESAQDVHDYFPYTVLVGTNWFMKPEHCNIILKVV